MHLNILILGAGVSGPALTYLLQSSPSTSAHNITILERATALRASGQQIDLKSQGVEVLKRMGLFEEMVAHCVNETGLEIVDESGKRVTVFGVSPHDERRRTLTSEYEIMRGDVVRVLWEASFAVGKNQEGQGEGEREKGEVKYEFGKSVTEIKQDDEGVDVTFSNGQKGRYDLVVGADGQGSRTRRLAFGEDVSAAAFKTLGVQAAYFSIPRIEGETGLARAYSAPGRRLIFTRTSDRPVTQVLLFTMGEADQIRKSYKEGVDKQKEAFKEAFQDAGWQAERFMSGLDVATDFYAHEVGQIKMPSLHTGRVVLLGDAGYCPSPFTGMGTTGCLVGAYVLAGELAKHGKDVPSALKTYDEIMKQPVKEIQDFPVATLGYFFQRSRVGIWVLRNVLWVVGKMDGFVRRESLQGKGEGKGEGGKEKEKEKEREGKGWKLPVYEELKLEDA